MGQEEAQKAATGGIAAGEKFSSNTWEEAARQSTLKDHGTPEEKFWQSQQGRDEVIAMGRQFIQQVCGIDLI